MFKKMKKTRELFLVRKERKQILYTGRERERDVYIYIYIERER